jgi:hypothetical protein
MKLVETNISSGWQNKYKQHVTEYMLHKQSINYNRGKKYHANEILYSLCPMKHVDTPKLGQSWDMFHVMVGLLI